MTEAPSIAIAAPMTADEVRLELLAQVLILGVGYVEALRRVEAMTLADGVKLPAPSTLRGWAEKAKKGEGKDRIRRRWEEAQSRRRKDAEVVKRAEAIRLVLNERLSRKAVGERLGVHPWTVTRWLTEPDAIEALMGEARVSAMMGALSLDDDIAKLRQYADAAEAEGELGLAASIRGKAADIEVKRLNGAAKVIVENTVQVANVNAPAGGEALAQVGRLLQQVVGPQALDVEEVEGGE